MTTTQHVSEFELQQRARERTATIESLLAGGEQGATAEIEQMSTEAEKKLREKSLATGSKAAGHAADVLKAQRMLVTSKDLGDRFLRIANRLEELRRTSTPGAPDVSQVQKQMESLRPLLRLMIRSEEFRTMLISALRVAKHVVEQNVEGSLESVMEKGEKQGMQAAADEAKSAVNQTMENLESKLDKNQNLISDSDWDKLANELDALFNKSQRHSEFRDSINQLFELGSSLSSQAKYAAKGTQTAAVQGVQKEAKEIVAQFSGGEELDRLTRSVNNLVNKLQNNPEAQKWWSEFRDHTLSITKNYHGRADVDKYRDMFHRGFKIFKEHKTKINHVIDRMNVVLNNIANDEMVLRLRESLATLSDDLFWQDQEGNRYFDAEAGGVLASSVSDVIRNQFQYLALPKVIRQEEDMAFTLDNLVISATLPDKIDFHLESYASLDTSALAVPGKSSVQTEIYLTATVRGITATAPNIVFTYEGTTISEAGVMSVTIPDPGADLAIDFVMRPSTSSAISSASAPTSWSTTTGSEKAGFTGTVGGGGLLRYEFVKIKSHFAIPDMVIDFDTQTLSHRFLVPLITSMFKARIIDRFESGVEEALDQGLVSLGQSVTNILNQAPNPLSISGFGSMMTAV